MKYKYLYQTSENRNLEGWISAPNRAEAYAALRKRGIRPYRLVRNVPPAWRRPAALALAAFAVAAAAAALAAGLAGRGDDGDPDRPTWTSILCAGKKRTKLHKSGLLGPVSIQYRTAEKVDAAKTAARADGGIDFQKLIDEAASRTPSAMRLTSVLRRRRPLEARGERRAGLCLPRQDVLQVPDRHESIAATRK